MDIMNMTPDAVAALRAELNKMQTDRPQRDNRSKAEKEDDYVKVDFGHNLMRLLPGWRPPTHPLAASWPFVKQAMHFQIPGAGRDGGYGFCTCIRNSYEAESKGRGVDCWVCANKERLVHEGVVASFKDFGRNAKLSVTFKGNAYSRRSTDLKARVVNVPSSVYDKPETGLLAKLLAYMDQGINNFHPYSGYDFDLVKTGNAQDTNSIRYEAAFAIGQPSALADSQEKIDAILASRADLDQKYAFPSDKMLEYMKADADKMYAWYKRSSGVVAPGYSAPSAVPGYAPPPAVQGYQPPQGGAYGWGQAPPAAPAWGQAPPAGPPAGQYGMQPSQPAYQPQAPPPPPQAPYQPQYQAPPPPPAAPQAPSTQFYQQAPSAPPQVQQAPPQAPAGLPGWMAPAAVRPPQQQAAPAAFQAPQPPAVTPVASALGQQNPRCYSNWGGEDCQPCRFLCPVEYHCRTKYLQNGNRPDNPQVPHPLQVFSQQPQ